MGTRCISFGADETEEDIMSEKIKKVAVITNYNIYDKAGAAMNVAKKLYDLGCEIFVSVYNKEKIIRMNKNEIRFNFIPMDEIYSSVDAVCVLGGDGTILESARRAAPHGTPVIGINLGRVGFMAEIEPDELDMLEKMVSGEYKIEERAMLSVEIINNAGKVRSTGMALNDAAITNGSIARIVDLELSEAGIPVATYRSDGIIIATPTGSTAYSMAAGGAIVDPRVACFCVTPICPHSLSSKPLVFPDSAVITIKNICQREKILYLTIDGRANFELYRGESVQITRSPISTKFISIRESTFYTKLRHKMNDK